MEKVYVDTEAGRGRRSGAMRSLVSSRADVATKMLSSL